MNLDPIDCVRPRNATAYALGHQRRNGFHVRRVVWGRIMARAERRPGEEVRRAIILVEGAMGARIANREPCLRRQDRP